MKLTGSGLADFAKSKKGTPYFYGSKMEVLTEAFMQKMHKAYPSTVTTVYMSKARLKKMVGKVCTDCSGLISAYTGKVLGSAQLYSQAYARMDISTWKMWAVGVVTYRKGHVGVYLGDGKVAEAKGIDYGVVITDITNGKWTHGLTFSWIDYSYTEKVAEVTYKAANPYTEPTRLLKKGCKGNDVKWLQFELIEAGYNIALDGVFGKNTYNALVAFQKSAKIGVDGICGKQSREALKGN